MSIEIRDVRAICTAPEGINLVAVKIETNEPELYGVGCATFAHRYSAVVTVINDYLRPFLIGKDVTTAFALRPVRFPVRRLAAM